MINQLRAENSPPALSVAMATYPHVAALKSRTVQSAHFQLDFADIPVINRAFAPMVRREAYDISEMAIATYFQARAHGKRLALLPIVLAARFQEGALLCLAESDIKGPEDLIGRRIGVRAYSQTSGMWLRGLLAERYQIGPSDMRWTTFEEAHVAEYRDPNFVQRAGPGMDMVAMLRAGELDAMIIGNDVPKDAIFRTVFPDIAGSARRFEEEHGFKPINHMVVIRRDLIEADSTILPELMRLFRAAREQVSAIDAADATKLPLFGFGDTAMEAALALALRYCADQELIPKGLPLTGLCDFG